MPRVGFFLAPCRRTVVPTLLLLVELFRDDQGRWFPVTFRQDGGVPVYTVALEVDAAGIVGVVDGSTRVRGTSSASARCCSEMACFQAQSAVIWWSLAACGERSSMLRSRTPGPSQRRHASSMPAPQTACIVVGQRGPGQDLAAAIEARERLWCGTLAGPPRSGPQRLWDRVRGVGDPGTDHLGAHN